MVANLGLYISVSLLTVPSVDEELQSSRFVEAFGLPAELGLEPRVANLPDAPQFEALAAKFIGQERAREAVQGFIQANKLEESPTWTDAEKLRLRDYIERLIGGSVGPAAARVVMDGYLASRGSRLEGVFDLVGEVSHSLEESREALKQRLNELSIINEAAQHSTSSLSISQILESILKLLQEKIGVDHCSIRLLDEDGVLRLESYLGPETLPLDELDLKPDMTTLVGQCLLDRKLISIPDTSQLAPQEVTGLHSAEMQASFILVPLATESQILGVLCAASKQKRFFPPEQLDFYRSLANQVSLAIHNARLYEKIIRFSRELETKVAERTLELKNKSLELAEANRALKELDRLKTEFLANVSHELRTPLNSILGYTQLLLDGVDGPLNEEQQKSLERVEKAGRRLLQLINDILDLSKLRAGRMTLNLEKASLHDILTEAIQTIEPLAAAKEIRLQIMEEEVPPLLVDRDKIIQVLLNLLSNAIKFTEAHGQVTVQVNQIQLPEAPGVLKEYVAVRVSDTGIGIKEEDLQNIFKEFVQVDTATTRRAGGTGLGLPISRHLVELHGGRIWAESEYGKGSTFTFILPLSGTEVQPAPAEAAPLPSRKVLALTRRGGLIHVLKETLIPLGFDFKAEPMVDQVLAEAGKGNLAAIIIDFLARDIPLLAAIRTLRTQEATRNVALVPVAFADDGRSGLVLGPAEFLKYPCTLEEFSLNLLRLEPWCSYKEALIIERHPEAAGGWSEVLQEIGFEATVVASGEEAIRHLENILPGLIIFNLELPTADFVRVVIFIRSQAETFLVPLLCLLPAALGEEAERKLAQDLREGLNIKKFPVANFIRQLKRIFSKIATEVT